jgi:hypothetical protein
VCRQFGRGPGIAAPILVRYYPLALSLMNFKVFLFFWGCLGWLCHGLPQIIIVPVPVIDVFLVIVYNHNMGKVKPLGGYIEMLRT